MSLKASMRKKMKEREGQRLMVGGEGLKLVAR
jgi:hypothetical protein